MDVVVLNGVRIAFDVHGSGSATVVLAGHIGAPGSASLPAQVASLTEAGYRVITFDPRWRPALGRATPAVFDRRHGGRRSWANR